MPRPAWPANHRGDVERSRQLLDEAASRAQASGANGVDHDLFRQISPPTVNQRGCAVRELTVCA
jgi:hypothetical protein